MNEKPKKGTNLVLSKNDTVKRVTPSQHIILKTIVLNNSTKPTCRIICNSIAAAKAKKTNNSVKSK